MGFALDWASFLNDLNSYFKITFSKQELFYFTKTVHDDRIKNRICKQDVQNKTR